MGAEIILGREYRRVIRRCDGRFKKENYDCANEWVTNPLNATQCTSLYVEDERLEEGAAIVEIEVTARLTGFTEAHLYENGTWVNPRVTPSNKQEG